MDKRQKLISLKTDFFQFIIKKTGSLVDEYLQENTAGKNKFMTITLGGSSYEQKLITFEESISIKDIKIYLFKTYKLKKYVKVRIFWEQSHGVTELKDDEIIKREDNVLFFTVEVDPKQLL